jgi:predicted nucleic acid-binding protein
MSAERFTLDTNILVYSIDGFDRRKHELAAAIIDAAVNLDCPIALQAVGEFYAAATKKLLVKPRDALVHARELLAAFETFSYSANAMRRGLEETARRRLSLWDAVLLASAAEAGCTVLLSEDMQDGMQFGSMTIVNPFGPDGLTNKARVLLEQ